MFVAANTATFKPIFSVIPFHKSQLPGQMVTNKNKNSAVQGF